MIFDLLQVTLKPKVHYSEFNVHVVTWNIASAVPSAADIESLFLPQESLLLQDLYNTTDLVVIGLQEAYQNMQDTLSSAMPVIGKDPLVEAFSDFLARKGFARLSFCRLLGILTLVFVKRPLLCYIRDVETCSTKTGFGGGWGTRGRAASGSPSETWGSASPTVIWCRTSRTMTGESKNCMRFLRRKRLRALVSR